MGYTNKKKNSGVGSSKGSECPEVYGRKVEYEEGWSKIGTRVVIATKSSATTERDAFFHSKQM